MAYLEDEKLDDSAMSAIQKMKKTPLTKRIVHEQSVMDSVGIALACQLFEEAKESFENGDMTWSEAVDDLHANLKEISEDLFKKESKEEAED